MRLPRRQRDIRNDRLSSVVLTFPVPRSDVGLVKALRAGHPSAVRALCDRHSGYLLRVAARILGPDEALVAVVAEAVQRSLDELDRLDDPRAIKVWLTRHLIAIVRQRLKARRRWRWLTLQRQVQAPTDGATCSDRLLATYRVLDRMSDTQRIVFCLSVIHSMSLAEVAAALGESLARVRGVLDRASSSFTRWSASEASIRPGRLQSAS